MNTLPSTFRPLAGTSTRLRLLNATALALAAALPMAPAAAQEGKSGTALSVSDEIVVTAARRQQTIIDAPASITVLDREHLSRRFYRDVTDALIEVPGVVVTGGGDRQDISLRGMGSSYTLILIDGRRQDTRETRPNSDGPGVEGGWTPPLEAIERIEVVRGPMSSLYGSDAMGGVINIITRKVAADWHGALRMDSTIQESGRSGDIYQGNLFLSGPLVADRLGLQVYGQYSRREEDDIYNGFRESTSKNLTAKLSFTPSKDHDIIAQAVRMEQDFMSTLGKTVEPLALGEECGRSGCPESSETGYRTNQASLSHTGRWGNGIVSDSYVQYEKAENPSRDMEITNKVASTSVSVSLGAHVLAIGGQYEDERLYDAGNQLDTGIDTLDRWQLGLFAENEWSLLKGFALTGGIRLDREENFGSHWSPRLYGVWRVNNAFTLKGGVSTGFRAPNLRYTSSGWGQVSRGGNIYGNPDLKPETSVNWEAGLMYNHAGVSAGLFAFYNDFKDKITRVACPIELCPDGPNQFGADPTTRINVDKAETQGIEANLSFPVTAALSVAANYTYTDSKQKTGEYAGDPLNQLPKHLATATLNADPSEDLRGWLRINYRGKESQPVTGPSQSALVAPSYTFVDFGASYDLTASTAVNFGVYNIFDKEVMYEEYGYVEDGRRYWAGVNTRF